MTLRHLRTERSTSFSGLPRAEQSREKQQPPSVLATPCSPARETRWASYRGFGARFPHLRWVLRIPLCVNTGLEPCPLQRNGTYREYIHINF